MRTLPCIESKIIYYLEKCRLGVLLFSSLSSIHIVTHEQSTINKKITNRLRLYDRVCIVSDALINSLCTAGKLKFETLIN
jgi:hypothetical protein